MPNLGLTPMGGLQALKNKKFRTMKTLKYILLLTLFLCVNLTSCTPDDSVSENEKLHTEVVATRGGDAGVEEGEN